MQPVIETLKKMCDYEMSAVETDKIMPFQLQRLYICKEK